MNIEKNYCGYCRINHGKLHADFNFLRINSPRIIIIKDLNKGNKSVTNDVEYVLWYIKCFLPRMANHYIIYKDSEGIYDELIIDKDGKFKGFRSLAAEESIRGQDGSERDLEKSIHRCLALHKQD